MKTVRRAALCAVSSMALAAPAFAYAQDPAPPAAAVQAFDEAFFKTYNPVTAADMVARVPGFELRDGDERRGFGATAGNVLINGERPSSKVLLSEQLKRIPAGMVIRVELISGGSSSDASGQSQVVNLVLRKATTAASPTTYVIGLRHIGYSGRIGWIAQASKSLPLGPNAELALDFQIPNLLGRGESRDVIRDGAGVITATRITNGQPKNRGLQGAGTLKWKPTASDSVNFNLQLAPTWNASENYSLEVTPAGALRNTLRGESEYDDQYTAEAGADWEHRFSPAFSTKLIGLSTLNSVDQTDTFETLTAPAARSTRIQARSSDSGERVGRGTATWRVTEAHTLEFGGEGAFNYRDTTLDITTQAPGGPLVTVPLAVSNARVEELRGEAFVADVWTVSPKLNVETGFTFEASRITQTGDQSKEREFTYAKPRISATYALSPTSQLRASLNRDVEQLDFTEFSSTVDFVNTSSIQGNPNLVPQQAWKSRIEWQRRFSARGALTLAAFYDAVEDVHDLIDVNGFDAYGNIGDGTRKGIEVRATLPLAFIGLPRAELRFNGLIQETEVTDPKTGEKRSFSITSERQGTAPGTVTLNGGDKDWAYVVNFRQEVPKLKSAFGFAAMQWAGRTEYKRAEIIEAKRDLPRVDLFVETTAFGPMTLRVYMNNIKAVPENRLRTFYVGDRASGIVSRTETRVSRGGPDGTRSYGFQVSGKF